MLCIHFNTYIYILVEIVQPDINMGATGERRVSYHFNSLGHMAYPFWDCYQDLKIYNIHLHHEIHYKIYS